MREGERLEIREKERQRDRERDRDREREKNKDFHPPKEDVHKQQAEGVRRSQTRDLRSDKNF